MGKEKHKNLDILCAKKVFVSNFLTAFFSVKFIKQKTQTLTYNYSNLSNSFFLLFLASI